LLSDNHSGPDIKQSLQAICPDCHVDLTTDPDRVLSILLSNNFDVLLFDVDSTNRLATKILSQIRRLFLLEQLPTLLISATDISELSSSDWNLDATDVLLKPLKELETKVKIRNALIFRHYFLANQSIRGQLVQEITIRTAKLNLLIKSGLMMGVEKNSNRLMEYILQEGQKLLHCDGGTMYLVTEDNTLRFAIRTREDLLPFEELRLFDPETGRFNENYVSTYAANHKKTVLIENVYKDPRFEFRGTYAFDAQTGYRTISLLTVPMVPHNGDVIGILQFINALDPETGQVIAFPEDAVPLVEALAAQAAVALDNLRLLAAQKTATESISRVLATALDTKSPHAGHHCVRVPELAIMLADAACRQTEGPLADFNFETEDQWFEFRVGAWLHDCGKITTPEFVIDKATKLDMLYNRIHEVRMRFEVLLRDAEINRLKAILSGVPSDQANQAFEQEKSQLQEDFAFIAECNIGRESMRDQDYERITTLAKKTWLRYFDDTMGLSEENTIKLKDKPKPSLPVTEHLLCDKPEHIIPRAQHEKPHPELGIKMAIPENMYNYGEIYNLSIRKGTLNTEDRYKINEHIIETINLLEKIPFPDFLRRVPEYASTHHETLDGRGYPRNLTAKELSIPARIMAIADVFEALTASDKPYKKPYKLSEALHILRNMKNNRHIDPDIYDLFLRSGIYRAYALKYLKPEQIDDIDIADFLERPSH